MPFTIYSFQDGLLTFGFVSVLDEAAFFQFEQKIYGYFRQVELTEPLKLLLVVDIENNGTLRSNIWFRLMMMAQRTQVGKIAVCYSERSIRTVSGTGRLLEETSALRQFRREREARLWLNDPLMSQLLSRVPLYHSRL